MTTYNQSPGRWFSKSRKILALLLTFACIQYAYSSLRSHSFFSSRPIDCSEAIVSGRSDLVEAACGSFESETRLQLIMAQDATVSSHLSVQSLLSIKLQKPGTVRLLIIRRGSEEECLAWNKRYMATNIQYICLDHAQIVRKFVRYFCSYMDCTEKDSSTLEKQLSQADEDSEESMGLLQYSSILPYVFESYLYRYSRFAALGNTTILGDLSALPRDALFGDTDISIIHEYADEPPRFLAEPESEAHLVIQRNTQKMRLYWQELPELRTLDSLLSAITNGKLTSIFWNQKSLDAQSLTQYRVRNEILSKELHGSLPTYKTISKGRRILFVPAEYERSTMLDALLDVKVPRAAIEKHIHKHEIFYQARLNQIHEKESSLPKDHVYETTSDRLLLWHHKALTADYCIAREGTDGCETTDDL